MAKKKSPAEGGDLIDGGTGSPTDESAARGDDQDGGQTANPETGAAAPEAAAPAEGGGENAAGGADDSDKTEDGGGGWLRRKLMGPAGATAKSPREAAREAAKKAERHKAIRNRLMVAALERQAYVLYPYPDDVDATEAKEVIAEMGAEGLAHDRIRPNLTAAGVAAAQELADQ